MIDKFLGDYEQAVDGKGRVSVPSPIRSIVSRRDPDYSEGQRANFVVVYGSPSWERLECYPIDEYTKITRGIEKMKRGTPERNRAQKLFFSRAFHAQIFEDGRILLPQSHRERLGLTEKVRFVGLGDQFNIVRAGSGDDGMSDDDFDAWLNEQEEGHVLSLIPDIDDE
ncbi:division/cell wall cluster transcriptional repressor MraZ [Pararhodobacter sp.]